MPISLSGMASGLDTESIIAQLMQIEQTKVTAVQKRQVAITQHKTDLSTIKSKLDAVKSAAADLESAALWKPVQTTSSSDPTKVDVTVLAGAGIGGHSVQVNKLASSAQHGYAFAKNAAEGKLTFFYGADPNLPDISKVEINVAANASATDVATLINANDKSPVYAAVIKEGTEEHLVFSSRKTGKDADFTVDTSALASPTQMGAELAKYQRVGDTLNADVLVDGAALIPPPQSNVIENALPGVRLTLKGISTSPVSVVTTQPTVDNDAIAKKITALVDAYNAVVTATRSELTEKRVPTATTSSDVQKGQLFGDSGMTSMLNALKSRMLGPLEDLGFESLSDLGIDVPRAGKDSVDARAGKISIDSTKLKEVIAADYTKVRDFFSGVGTAKGLSDVLSDYVGTQTGAKGSITTRMSTDDSALKGFTAQIDKMNLRMEAESKRLKAQFAAMEAALHNSQTQQAWLTSQISSLPSW